MPPVTTRGHLLTTVAAIVILAAGGTAGCSADPATADPNANAQHATASARPSASRPAVKASPTAGRPSARPSPTAARRSTAPKTTTKSTPAPAGVARECRMADLRFWLSLGLPMAGPYGGGSVQMTNIAADRCRVSGYMTVRWLDANGKPMPITVERIPGSMPAYTSLLQPGQSANAGLRWTRSRALPSDPDILCPPAPASIEARLSAASAWARMAWTPGEGLCDNKAGLQPIEKSP
jgi:hypothetical protein